MTLRAKTLLVVGVTMGVMIALLIAVAASRMTAEFLRLEREDSRKTSERLQYVVKEETEHLAEAAFDLSARSSSYRFLTGANPDMVETNLTERVLSNMGVNFVVMLDDEGRPAAARFMDLDLGMRTETDSRTVSAITEAKNLQKPGDPHGMVSGTLSLPGGTALVAAHSVTTPDMYTAPAGTCVVGRFVDAAELERLSEVVKLPVSLATAAGPRPPGVPATRIVAAAEATASPIDDARIGVWLTQPDLATGRPIVFRAVQPRTIRRQGVEAMAYLSVSLLLLGAGLTLSTLLLVDRVVLARLSRLSAELTTIASRRDASFRVWESGTDEISKVARDVNQTLTALDEVEEELESAREELEERVEERTAALSASEARYRALIEGMADGVMSVDRDGTVTFANERMDALVGADEASLLGTSLYGLMTTASAEDLRHRVEGALDEHTMWTSEVELVCRGEGALPVELHASALLDESGRVSGVQLIAHDISERRRQERQLVHLASHDHLTGLHNRRFFEAATEVELAEVRRTGATGAVLWLDVDDFKDINDTLGHRVGDEVLVAIAEQLRKQVRESNVLARIGGDEFAVLMTGVDPDEAQVAAARILSAMNSMTYACGEHLIRVSASMGIVLFPAHGTSVAELLACADLAMYDAKARGRSRLHLYRPDDRREADIRTRVLWNERITDALHRERFVLYAQPVLDTRTDTIVRYELLIRMLNDQDEILAPIEFLPSAERLGLIRDIDHWVVRRAVEVLAQHEGVDWSIEANLSGNALGDGELLEDIERLVREAGVEPSRLGFEITETAAISDIPRARDFIGRLSEIGCRFSLDDFGSGFSSFYYLKHLPIDCLKVDGSFIRGLPHNKQDQHLVRGIVELCRALRIEVAAEYVESAEVLREVRDLGMDYAQGYYVGRPVPLAEAMERHGETDVRDVPA